MRSKVRVRVGVMRSPPWSVWPRAQGYAGQPQHHVIAPPDAAAAHGSQQRRDAAPSGQHRAGIGVTPRGQDERAFLRARVRQRQRGIAAHLVAVNDDVHVEGPRSPAHVPGPLRRRLERVGPPQQVSGRAGRLRQDDRVQVVRLFGAADRSGLVHRRDGGDVQARCRRQRVHGPLQLAQAVPQVAAQGDDHADRALAADGDRYVAERAAHRRVRFVHGDPGLPDGRLGQARPGQPFRQRLDQPDRLAGHDRREPLAQPRVIRR